MAPDASYTVNQQLPMRRWVRPYSVTLSDVNADKNLQRDGKSYRYLQNVGTSGLIMIVWETASDLMDIYLAQGEVIEGGNWIHARLTGTGAGVALRGFVGVDGVP